MNNAKRYMNDTDIIDEPMALREVHAIRFMIADEIKSMTSKERTALIHKEVGEAMAQYGLAHLRVKEARRVL